ncbi:MAG: formate dehydrogenase accessory sulfurtransferase FdhD, partial [Lautropia sp.]|nr:formate dehydrogenase accessory sulfurtransferase FdhD [Lautropia sp.]
AIFRAESGLKAKQLIRNLTGATHAAAWCDLSGQVLMLREDVGRHNALDKLIGAMTRAGTDASQGFIAITSRASFEMVQKTAMARVGALVAVSAPTGLAIETARQHGIALAGLVRDGRRLVAYTWPERLGLGEQG